MLICCATQQPLAGRAILATLPAAGVPGCPAFYGVTILTAAENADGAEAFVRFLLSGSSLNKLERAGFLRAEIVAAGDLNAIPSSPRSLVRERSVPRLSLA